jgi:hypothetical protein
VTGTVRVSSGAPPLIRPGPFAATQSDEPGIAQRPCRLELRAEFVCSTRLS